MRPCSCKDDSQMCYGCKESGFATCALHGLELHYLTGETFRQMRWPCDVLCMAYLTVTRVSIM